MENVKVVLKKGDILIRENEESRNLYWVQSGELTVLKKVADRSLKMNINTLKKGDLVGELSFIDQRPRSATVQALTDCELIKLDYDEFQKLLQQQPKWIIKIMNTMSDKLRKLSEI